MKTAVIGAGAIGSVVAAYLTKAQVDVTLIGRPDQVAAIERDGLAIKGIRGEETVQVKVASSLATHCDLVILTVKTQDIYDVVADNKELLKDSLILSSQNGVRADSLLRESFSEENIFSSIVMFGSTYVRPGEVTFNFEGDWILGKPYGPADERLDQIRDVLSKAFSIVPSDDIIAMKWLKLFVNFNNCIPALIGKSMQETFADMDLCRLSIMLSQEGFAIVKEAGIQPISLPNFPLERITGLLGMPLDQAAGIINKTLTSLSKEPLYGSILQSIMRKRLSEIDYINGEVVRLADDRKMNVPLNRKIVELVHEVEETGKYFRLEDIKNKFKLAVGATDSNIQMNPQSGSRP